MKKSIVFIFLAFSISMQAQEFIKLYPNGTPGLKDGVSVKEDISKSSDGIIRVRDITAPDLKVYRPKKNPTGSSVIICPGGGYHILAYNHEGDEVAKWFAQNGVTAFILKYRLPQGELFENKEIRPLQDAQQAFRIVRAQSAKFGLDPNKVGIMGFSAGGHLAATASTKYGEQIGEIVDEALSVRPDFSILIYPVISFNDKFGHSGSRNNLIGPDLKIDDIDKYSNELHVDKNTPPAFLVHAFDDPVKIENSFAYAQALKKYGVNVEFHAYEKGGHGFSMSKKGRGPVETWPARLADWMKANGWML